MNKTIPTLAIASLLAFAFAAEAGGGQQNLKPGDKGAMQQKQAQRDAYEKAQQQPQPQQQPAHATDGTHPQAEQPQGEEERSTQDNPD